MASDRGPYAKTAAVRLRIVEAATDLFASSGYRGATMKQIAASCGLTAKGVAHHFPTKDELLMAVLAERDRKGRQVTAKNPEASSIEALFEALAVTQREPRIVELYTVLSAEAIALDHPAHEYHRERYERVRDSFTLIFQTAIDEGARFDLSAAQLAVLLVAVIDGLQIQWLYDQEAIDLEPLARAFIRLISGR